MLSAVELPQPSPDAAAISTALSDSICDAINRAGGAIGFDEFMRRALYEPDLGYYVAGTTNFGAAGDFLTAPEISSLFAQCVATQCADILSALGGGEILEFGGGSGRLAAGLLNYLADLDALPEVYSILELSPALRLRQDETIAREAASHRQRVRWLDALPRQPLQGVILANEIVDALPVKVFRLAAGKCVERCVEFNGKRFAWHEKPASDASREIIRERLPATLCRDDTAYDFEINIGLEPWIADLSRALARGAALLIDYGYPRAEYYHPQRRHGSLVCHVQHRKHDDPFWYPGLQDITAAVDFTAVAMAATEYDLQVRGFVDQANFLISTGLLEHLEMRRRDATQQQWLQLTRETNVLTSPQEMGTRFKLMALAKRYDGELRGLRHRDDRHRL